MNSKITVLTADSLESGELMSCISVMFGIDFEFETATTGEKPEGYDGVAIKYKSHTKTGDFNSQVADIAVSVIDNDLISGNKSFLDQWYDSEETFYATLMCAIAQQPSQAEKSGCEKLQASLDRIPLFDDSNELSAALRGIADQDDYLHTADKYYLKECAENIDGMYSLLEDIKKEIGEKSQ